MPRTKRVAPGGYVYHVLNRGVGRMHLFDKARDYEAFEEILGETLAKTPLRVCGFCRMPNHWHFLPEALGLKPAPGLKVPFNIGAFCSEHGEWHCWEGTGAENWRLDQAGTLRLQ